MSEETLVVAVKVKGGKTSSKDLEKLEGMGLDLNLLAEKINKKTSRLEGMIVEVRIHYYKPTRDYYIEVIPTDVTELLLWKTGTKSPSGDPAHNKIGDIGIEDLIHLAIIKKSELLTRDLRKAVKMLLGSARSIGLTVEGKDPKEVLKLIDDGGYEEVFNKYAEEWSEDFVGK